MCLIPVSGASLALSDMISDAGETGPHPADIFKHKEEFHLETLTRDDDLLRCFLQWWCPGCRLLLHAACNNPAVITIIQPDPLRAQSLQNQSSQLLQAEWKSEKYPKQCHMSGSGWHLLPPWPGHNGPSSVQTFVCLTAGTRDRGRDTQRVTRICHLVSRSVTRHISIQNVTPILLTFQRERQYWGDGKNIFAFKNIHSSHVANSNCQAWNICIEEAQDTDRAQAGGDLGSGLAGVTRGKTVIRVASEATSRTEAGNGTRGRGRGHQPPGAGGNLEIWGVIIGHELLKQEGNIHVNIRVNVARRTTASLTSDKHFNLTESTLNTNLNMMKLLARCHSQHDGFLGWLWRCIQPEITKDIFSRNESRNELCEQAAGLIGTTPIALLWYQTSDFQSLGI